MLGQPADAPMPAAEQQALTAKIKTQALRFEGQLPDFIATEAEARFEDNSGTGKKWKQRDVLEMQVYFAQGGQTVLKLQKKDGKPAGKDYVRSGGMIDPEFLHGAILPVHLFGPVADPAFEWVRWDQIDGRRVAVLAFKAKPFIKNYPDGKHGYLITFHGIVYADPSDGMPWRLEVEGVGPPGYPFQESGWDTDYRAVQISGRELVLPVKAVSRLRRGNFLARNEMQFSNYRKYEADSTVTFR